MQDFLNTVAALAREGQSFATATVVARQPPVSAHLGDRAIVYPDGRMDGFVGGACSREIIRQQALEALRARHARLVSIRPDATAASTADPEHVIVAMACVSEGAVDVYVEPFVPKRRLVVVGTTPVAAALTRIALSLSYDVVRVVEADERRDLEQDAASVGVAVKGLDTITELLSTGACDTAVVVASQGHYDEQALEAALKGRVEYVGLVASRKRGATILELLESQGVPGVDSVCNPAGIDLGARTPSEVALSILAQIVQRRPSQAVSKSMAPASHQAIEATAAASSVSTPAAEPTALDPVCGMSVTIAAAKHTAEVDSTVYYFCCPSCRARFVQEPARYLAARP